MIDNKYVEKANNLLKVIDIAIEVIKEFPPKDFNSNHIETFVNGYLEFKNRIENAEAQYKNLKSLSYVENDLFTYFQEGNGKAVNEFWIKVREHNLPFKRINKLPKILKRKKIKNRIEYDYITDVILPFKQEKIITDDQVNLLESLLKDFESKK
ncbi:hypothetical protein [Flavobacterium sp. 1355]|jgi:hypothetical protein|uniref:hypothetical protein n=1 Tax=Flavobacterium sp. 1355 TaxID=2806571 RepID=UPI001AE80966|nr:hypothetical protein [Flavobacterium sp. 1355]MBP1223635.1 hypothetical protein [Flavobacterium sp. 1355]